MLPIALNGTLLDCLTIRSQVGFQDALKHTPEHALKDAPTCTRWHTRSLLDNTIPMKLTRCSQAHSRARSQVHTQFHSMPYSQSTWLHAPKYTLKRQDTLISLDYMLPCMLLCARSRDLLSRRRHARGDVRQVTYGGQCLAGVVWCVACGVWQVAGGVWWPKSRCQAI